MKTNIFPFWMIAASGFIAISVLVVGISLYINPSIFFNKVMFDSSNLQLLLVSQRLAATMIAIGLSIGIALFSQSVSMLKVSMACYCFVTLQDTVLGFAHEDIGLMVGSFIFCVLAAFIIFIANGLKRKRKRMHFLKTTSTSARAKDSEDDDE